MGTVKKKKKVTQKKPQKPVKRGFSMWGYFSSILGIVYMTYFLYLLYVFMVMPTMSFVYILYAFILFPAGIIGFVMSLFAIRNREPLGFVGLFTGLIGAFSYCFIWYEILKSPLP